MIRMEGVRKWLGGKLVLDGIDLEIRRGETLVIVGPSGTGKSVTLRHMVRLMTPDDGRVWIENEVVSEAHGTALERLRRRFGVLFQSGALLEWLTVGENVALRLREEGRLTEAEIERRVMEKLDLVGLGPDCNKFPSEISGGMRKRAALARAIVHQPEIILYDEPTSGLDPVSSRTIDALIKTMNRELGVTSVVVTHDLHSALSIGNRIAMLFNGHIVAMAGPDDFIRSEQPVVRQFLEAQFITRKGAWEH